MAQGWKTNPIVAYDWELENGISSAEPNPSHVYSTPGTYNALLIVTDNDGLSRSTTVTIVVNASPNQSPVAVASAPVTTGYAPLTVNSSSAGSYDPDGTVAAYAWNLFYFFGRNLIYRYPYLVSLFFFFGRNLNSF